MRMIRWLKKAELISQTKVSIVLEAEAAEPQEVVVTVVVEDVVAAEVGVTNLLAAEGASNVARKATFHEIAPTRQPEAVEWAATVNATNVVSKVISHANVPQGALTNVSDARKGVTLVGIALRVEAATASTVTNLVTCPESAHKRER
jgi:hypothetical protein